MSERVPPGDTGVEAPVEWLTLHAVATVPATAWQLKAEVELDWYDRIEEGFITFGHPRGAVHAKRIEYNHAGGRETYRVRILAHECIEVIERMGELTRPGDPRLRHFSIEHPAEREELEAVKETAGATFFIALSYDVEREVLYVGLVPPDGVVGH